MRFYVRAEERRPDPPPLDTDLRHPIVIGIGVWTVLFLVALAFKGRLDERGLDWWVWTPLIGALLGAYGLHMVYARARRERRPRRAGRPGEQAEPAGQPAAEAESAGR
jgi:hypothetical protein